MLWMDLNENFRICQKWTELQLIKFSHISGSPSRSYSGFVNLECPNSKSYRWILTRFLKICHKWANLQLITFSDISRLPPGHYSGFANPECPNSKKLWMEFHENFGKWTNLQIYQIFCCSSRSLSGNYTRFIHPDNLKWIY